MHFIVYCPDISHVSVDTVHPSLLWSPSSSSSPRWYRLRCLSSDNFLVSSLHVSKPQLFRFYAPICYVLFIQSLRDVTNASLVVSYCLAYLHILICLNQVQHSWTILLWIFALTCGGILLSHDNSKYSSSCCNHTVSSCALMNLSLRCYTVLSWKIAYWHFLLEFHSDMCILSLLLTLSSLSSPRLPSTAPFPPPVLLSPFRTAPHHPVI